MDKYKVEIIETLSRVIEVEAEDKDEAYQKVKSAYYNGTIILEPEDCVEVEFYNWKE